MNNYKKFSFLVTTLFFGVTSFIILFNYIVDPFQIYRKTKLYTFKVQDQRYLNAGLAKNYPYNTLLVGTSMTENFYLHDMKKNPNFSKPMKLSFEGASIYEISDLLQLAIHSNKELKNIIIGVDFLSFKKGAKQQYMASTFPKYLYDTNPFNDMSYLLNFKIFKKSLLSLKRPYSEEAVAKTLDTIYNWQKEFNQYFTLENIRHTYINNNKKEEQKTLHKLFNEYQFQYLKENFDKRLYPILKNNPQINFYLFYPPHSVLIYKVYAKANILQDILHFKKYIFQKCKDLPNVKIYDLQVDFQTTNNLQNYKDLGHYHEKINKLILQNIQKNNYLVSEKNIDLFIKELEKNTQHYSAEKYLNLK